MKIIRTLLVSILAVFATSAEPLTVSNADQMNALRKAVDEAYTVCYTTNDQSGMLYKTLVQLENTNVPKMFLLAQKEPDSQAACDVFLWIAMKAKGDRVFFFTNRLQSLDYLTKYHSTNSKLGPLCSYLGRYWEWRWRDKPVVNFLESVAKNNPNHATRGQAIYGLGRIFASKSEMLAGFENWGKSPFFTNSWTTNDLAEFARSGRSQVTAAEAELQFKQVISDYADCEDLRERLNPSEETPKLKKLAEDNLFELQHLSLGKMAPEIEAEGIDGKTFKLSDSRGKIRVLSFWASWCHPCMEMVPVECALVERLRGKSFALIGVNGDNDLANAKRAMDREKMTWPSFWNGKGGSEGPISKAWNVQGWPTIFVLDPAGVIRLKTEGYSGPQSSNELNGSVDELMKMLPRKKL